MIRLGSTLTFLALLTAAVLVHPQPAAASTPDAPGGLSGTLMIGDSTTWRVAPSLQERHPDWHIDAKRGRPVKALGPRLRHYQRHVNPNPANLVMALGTNRSSEPPWTKRRYLHALSTLPDEATCSW